mgnify:CR=1 FL=1
MDIKVAVVGGSGVVGRAILEDLTATGINYVALSRRPPDLRTAGAPCRAFYRILYKQAP